MIEAHTAKSSRFYGMPVPLEYGGRCGMPKLLATGSARVGPADFVRLG